MDGRHTQAWWLVRVELAAGIGVTLLIGQLALALAQDGLYARGHPPFVFVGVASLAIAVAGLVRMIRIFGGPRDEPQPWRYRDR